MSIHSELTGQCQPSELAARLDGQLHPSLLHPVGVARMVWLSSFRECFHVQISRSLFFKVTLRLLFRNDEYVMATI